MGETSIPCREATRDRLRDDKTPGVSWDRYLNDLLDAAERADDADAEVPPGLLEVHEATDEELEEIKRRIEKMPKRTADELEARLR